jgi:hypothetical protein
MKQVKKDGQQLSYESDGKMGSRKKGTKNNKEQAEFFNTTQNSE